MQGLIKMYVLEGAIKINNCRNLGGINDMFGNIISVIFLGGGGATGILEGGGGAFAPLCPAPWIKPLHELMQPCYPSPACKSQNESQPTKCMSNVTLVS